MAGAGLGGLIGLAGMALSTFAGAAWGAPANTAVEVGAPLSAAVGVDARFRSAGLATELGPVAAVSGQPSGRYDASTRVAAFYESVALAPLAVTPTVYLFAKTLSSHATASGFGVDSRSSRGDTSLADVKLSMNLYPPPPGSATAVPRPFLTITAHGMTSSASFSTVVPRTNFAVGHANVGSLTVAGQFLGGAVLKYSGPAPPNTVIYDSPTVTITLNRQMKTGIISCSPNCVFTVTSLDVAAVDVELNKAAMGSSKISGDIVLGDATAQ